MFATQHLYLGESQPDHAHSPLDCRSCDFVIRFGRMAPGSRSFCSASISRGLHVHESNMVLEIHFIEYEVTVNDAAIEYYSESYSVITEN